MKTLTLVILEARDFAAAREPDFRITEFLRSMYISPHGGGADPSCATINAHWKSWYRYFPAEDVAEMRLLSLAQLADAIAVWVQGGFDNGLLSLSNPPTALQEDVQAPRVEPCALGGGLITTYTYDIGDWLVGKRTG